MATAWLTGAVGGDGVGDGQVGRRPGEAHQVVREHHRLHVGFELRQAVAARRPKDRFRWEIPAWQPLPEVFPTLSMIEKPGTCHPRPTRVSSPATSDEDQSPRHQDSIHLMNSSQVTHTPFFLVVFPRHQIRPDLVK